MTESLTSQYAIDRTRIPFKESCAVLHSSEDMGRTYNSDVSGYRMGRILNQLPHPDTLRKPQIVDVIITVIAVVMTDLGTWLPARGERTGD